MKFAVVGARPLEPLRRHGGFEPSATTATELAGTLTMTLAPPRLAPTVLPRLLGLLATRAELSSDSVSNAKRVASVLARNARQSGNAGQLSVGILTKPRSLELRIAPLPTGLPENLLADAGVDGQGRVVASLAAEEATDNHQTLILRLLDRPVSTSEAAGL
jgi:hypothetical protein